MINVIVFAISLLPVSAIAWGVLQGVFETNQVSDENWVDNIRGNDMS